MKLLYDLGILLLALGFRVAAPFKPKARLGLKGRKNWRNKLAQAVSPGSRWIWFHCASLGEFEQGRNLLEALRSRHRDYKILLTFFSSSGYEVRADYDHADLVLYLPLDTPANARFFLKTVQPALGVFVRYDFWINYLLEARRQSVPMILISARLRPDQPYFKSALAHLYRQALEAFQCIFTQDQPTVTLLESTLHGPQIIESADTRYDRVLSNRKHFQPIPEIDRFIDGRPCLVAGSTWTPDEELLLDIWPEWQAKGGCLIIAPHEIDPQRIEKWIHRYPEVSLRYSQLAHNAPQNGGILWIDNIGMLSRLYAYGQIAYVGGAFGQGLHNILEPVVFGLPVIFGPKVDTFPEASDLQHLAIAFPVASKKDFLTALKTLEMQETREAVKQKALDFVEKRSGATQQILTEIERRNLLA